jgi:hypothetical protein
MAVVRETGKSSTNEEGKVRMGTSQVRLVPAAVTKGS